MWLLPSGPDQVGEALARANPSEVDIGRNPIQCKIEGKITIFSNGNNAFPIATRLVLDLLITYKERRFCNESGYFPMIEILVLMGVGLLLTSLDSVDDTPADEDGGSDTSSESEDDLNAGDDVVIDGSFADVADLILTPEQLDGALVSNGAFVLNTGGGNDVVITGDADDDFRTGSGDDIALAGDGDDQVALGSGDDQYGSLDTATAPNTALGNSEAGNDIVLGGLGNDTIIDQFGSNILRGQDDSDTLNTVDAETEPTPDEVSGGNGDDFIFVDQGDRVETGDGADTVTMTVSGEPDPLVITISDFSPDSDAIQLQGVSTDDIITFTQIGNEADGTLGTNIAINGTIFAEVIGGASLTLADIVLIP